MVYLDGKRLGTVALAPYTQELGVLEGEHTVNLIAFGNRVNTFGALHNTDRLEDWYGSPLWRTKGNCFSYDYQLKESGVLTTPRILSYKTEE